MGPVHILTTLFESFTGVQEISPASGENSYFQRITFVYGSERLPLTAEYSSACLEVYSRKDVPPELIRELTATLSGAKYERYNSRTHYWSGKVIDDFFRRDDTVLRGE